MKIENVNEKDIAKWWLEYFDKLLMCEEFDELLQFDEPVTVDEDNPHICLKEIRENTHQLKNSQNSGEDGI